MFYAYVHARPNAEDAKSVFYVGKGTARRASSFSSRNNHYGSVVKKHGAENILVGKLECSSEVVAFELEKGLIKCLRRMGVSLTNQTGGGEGASGYRHDADNRAKMSAAVRLSLTSEVIMRRSRSIKEALSSEKTKAKMSASALRVWRSADHKENMTRLMKDLWNSTEFKEKQRVARKKSWENPEIKATRSAAVKQAKMKPEARKKVSETMKRVYEEPALRQQASVRTKGKVWVNDGAVNRRVMPNEVPEGFERGRLPLKTKNQLLLR